MDSHEELLKKILALSLSNAQLRREVEQLESNREFLERRFAVNKISLNGVIEGLPGVLDILILEKPPPSCYSLTGGTWARICSVVESGRWLLDLFHGEMSNIRDVNMDVMSAEEEARASKLKAAHLASTAARQGSDCFETIQMVSKAKFQTEELLRATTGQISDAERHIQESKELTRIMAENARYHVGKAEEQIGWLRYTFWIPIINVVAVPLCSSQMSQHLAQSASYKSLEYRHQTEITTKTWEKLRLEEISGNLNIAIERLKDANKACSETEKQSSRIKDQAKELTDQYNVITTGTRDVLHALDPLHSEFDVDNWDRLRHVALKSILQMMESLHAAECLQHENLALLERLRTINSRMDHSSALELEW